MNVLSLFDGISCGRVALERANIKVDKYYSSEIDKNAIVIADNNYSQDIKNKLGDITKWREWDIDDIDLVIGGSPCQGFSIAGKQLNFKDERSKLVFDYIDIVNHFKPKYFLLENVHMKQENEKKLNDLNIKTVLDLVESNANEIKKRFSVVMARTVLELQGISCIPIEPCSPDKQQIISSRSFGQRVTNINDLKEAIGMHTQDAVRRLRSGGQLCSTITVFAESSYFDKRESYYSRSIVFKLPEASDCVADFVKLSTYMINHVYKLGVKFKKCGVILTQLEPKNKHTYDLLTDMMIVERKENFMIAYEGVHNKYGKKKLALGTCYLPNRNWSMSRGNVTRNLY